ncbi:MAG: N-acetyl-gamma-glutamyl-phosphate reductase [Clostridia bacterium]|nr:N-acetyl-gamma-glutamyl-phosphate reductase [Clostridia bacterium]
MARVFIDGSAGTTGLRIHERLSTREDLEIITLTEELRKDTEARREAINNADIVFLCLPDAAAKEAVELCDNPNTVIIDTSTAHRTNPDWSYGFPEIGDLRAKIKTSKRIANPGCHASGFVALVAPLVSAGLIDKEIALTCFSLTGYSGGGKKMIAEYESEERDTLLDAPRQYGITQSHKHLPEMKLVCGLDNDPIFCPIVADYYSGMEVTVPLFMKDVKGTIDDIKNAYKSAYTGKLVHFDENASEEGFMSANALSGRDDMQISVNGNDDRIILTARFDNLGKGASGAAIQNMNIVLGADETTGLVL